MAEKTRVSAVKYLSDFIVKGAFCAFLTYFSGFANLQANASPSLDSGQKAEPKSFNAGEMIMHHISDAHEIHFFTLNEGDAGAHHYSLYLPIIIKGKNGWDVFSSSHFYHHPKQITGSHDVYTEHNGYVLFHEQIYYAGPNGGLTMDSHGHPTNEKPLDMSITKSVAGLFIAGILVLLIFISVASSYKKRRGMAPRGLQSFLEPLILFIRDEVAVPSIGAKKADKFMPFLLSSFFFIWMANILGLIPFLGGFNVMGTLGVTLVLATVVFIITTLNGNRNYWVHILWPHGVPLPIKFILVPIEIIGIFIKPAVLMIRLTANITAGHIIILSFVSLIFIFGQQSAGAGYGVGVGSLLFMVFMNVIELLVAFLQAYVFTLLAAIYFGSAVEEAHHH
jgi:F-type H+-transporting ATPase subunit a